MSGFWGSLFLRMFRVYKFFVHFLSGKSEIERICLSANGRHTPEITLQLEQAFRRSKQLQYGSFPNLHTHLLSMPPHTDPEHMFDLIVASKKIPKHSRHFDTFRGVLLASLNQMRDVSRLVAQLDEARQPYESKNPEHEQLLMRLWNLLRPNVRLSQRISNEWGEIGFQGNDPATDFRGSGWLGLDQLVQFSADYPQESKRILNDSVSHPNWFSYAITSINMTMDAYMMLKRRELNAFFYQYGPTLSSFYRLQALMFVRFNQAWSDDDPENVMAFKRIHDPFIENIKRDSRLGQLRPLH